MTTAAATPTGLEISRLTGSLGAEIRGVSLAQADAADAEAILDQLMEHKVLFFPDQHLTEEAHLAFGRLFGKLEGHPNITGSSEVQELFELRASRGAVADEWHSDLTCQEEPSVFAILNMVKCPSVGGDTMWSNMVKAYEALSAPLQELCEGLSALHDAQPHGRPEQMAVHPVVRVHPVTGKKSLFVNQHFTRRIVELSHDESEMLLPYLTRWAANPRFALRYRWAEGTIAMWDNRCTQHCVLEDFEEERVIQRCTIMGDHPKASAPSRWEPFTRSGAPGAHGRHDRQLKSFLDGKKRAF